MLPRRMELDRFSEIKRNQLGRFSKIRKQFGSFSKIRKQFGSFSKNRRHVTALPLHTKRKATEQKTPDAGRRKSPRRSGRSERKFGTGDVEAQISNTTELEHEEITNVFYVIFVAASAIGLPFSPGLLSRNSNGIDALVVAWSILVTSAKTVWIFLEVIYNNLLWTSNAVRACYLIHCLAGYIATWVLIWKRRQVADAVLEIRRLTSGALKSDATAKTFRLKAYLFASFLYVSAFLALSVYFSFYLAFDSYVDRIKCCVPFSEEGSFYHAFNWLVVFSVMVSYSVSTATLHVATLICAKSYQSSGELLALYEKNLGEEVICKRFDALAASRNTILFKDIIRSIHSVDKAVGVCALIIYIAVINGIYNFLSVILSQDGRFRSFWVDLVNGMILLSALCMFGYMTVSGEKLPAGTRRLKLRLIELSGVLLEKSHDHVTLLKFQLLADEIKCKHPCATGFDLFDVNKHLFLPVLGVVISYFSLFYQIGATVDS